MFVTIITDLRKLRMSKIIIGIDPDSKAHGVAVYMDGKLTGLNCLTLVEIVKMIPQWQGLDKNLEFHIEDVCANNAAFQKSGVKNAKAATAINRSVGKCQQAQIELERFLGSFLIFPVKHKISKLWKKDKAQFEKVTGWKGRSNEDTRSAAYFGWLGCKK